MTIRKGKLHKPCANCKEYFLPKTKHTHLCDDCFLECRRIIREKNLNNRNKEVLAS